MEDAALVVGTIAALSLTVTKVVDFIRNLLDRSDTYPSYVWSVLALAVGVLFALGWSINFSQSVANLVPALEGSELTGWSGEAISGLVIGAGAGFWHEALDALSGIASARHAEARQMGERRS